MKKMKMINLKKLLTYHKQTALNNTIIFKFYSINKCFKTITPINSFLVYMGSTLKKPRFPAKKCTSSQFKTLTERFGLIAKTLPFLSFPLSVSIITSLPQTREC